MFSFAIYKNFKEPNILQKVKAKKHLGQHFLTDLSIAKNIVDALSQTAKYKKVVEVERNQGEDSRGNKVRSQKAVEANATCQNGHNLRVLG